jgi:hypothetical protein
MVVVAPNTDFTLQPPPQDGTTFKHESEATPETSDSASQHTPTCGEEGQHVSMTHFPFAISS